jgi:hypothetical protein
VHAALKAAGNTLDGWPACASLLAEARRTAEVIPQLDRFQAAGGTPNSQLDRFQAVGGTSKRSPSIASPTVTLYRRLRDLLRQGEISGHSGRGVVE